MDKQEIFDGLLDSFEAINDEMAQHQDNEFRQSENFKPFFARLLAMGELLREMDETFEDIKLERTHTPYFWAGFAAYGLATIIWQPSKTDGVLCDPDSLVQGHAIWHLLGAVAMWCFYKYFRTEIDSY